MNNEFMKSPDEAIIYYFDILKNRTLQAFELDLQRGKNGRELFQPIIDIYSKLLFNDFNSLKHHIFIYTLEKVLEYEKKNKIEIDKTDLYFLLALSFAINGNITNSLIYFELAKTFVNEKKFVNKITNEFKTLFNSIDSGYQTLKSVSDNSISSSFLPLGKLIKKLTGNSILHLLLCGIKTLQIIHWINEKGLSIEILKIIDLDLIISLSVLNESVLKQHSWVTKNHIGGIIDVDLRDCPKHTALFRAIKSIESTYVANTISKFNNDMPKLIYDIKNNKYNQDEYKARIIKGFQMVRNSVAHDLNPTYYFYQSKEAMIDTIGLLFACTSIIADLK
ncbi:hypothetical protein D9V86_06200 [Bacteroidetes/Chlorobi group bacterium ChocPot_Mid]|nr:MAG: hypothetical protein D9V86_06200 [Bacteroidetes/Chlorobi group bacterium ChocPot_Mid]